VKSETWTVVKVGGSLYEWADLPARLRSFMKRLDAGNVMLVPGGGDVADAIRAFDRTHQLGEEASHWLALQALSVNARFLQALLPEAEIGASGPVAILDAYPFFMDDEARPDHLPHRWDVTSDSLAVRAACLLEAKELILLKSTSWAGNDWREAHEAGVVDAYFADAVRQRAHEFPIRVVNLRASEV